MSKLGFTGVDDQGVAAKFCDACVEGEAGAGRGFIKDDGYGLGARQGLVAVAVSLHGGSQIEHLRLLGGGEVGVFEEVADHGFLLGVGAAFQLTFHYMHSY